MANPRTRANLGKRVRESFFTLEDEAENLWRCVGGTKRKTSGSGYTNFVSHVSSKHPDQYVQHKGVRQSATTTFVAEDRKSFLQHRSFEHNVLDRFDCICVAEDSQDADQHKEYFEFVLDLYGRSFKNVVVLLGDNCSTNQSFARKVNTPLVGCASHRFNLAVHDIIAPHRMIVAKVNALMKTIRRPISAAKLRKHTHLRGKCNNGTLWSSTAAMLRRYQQLQCFLPQLQLRLSGLDKFMPAFRERDSFKKLCAKIQDLDNESATKRVDDSCRSSMPFRFSDLSPPNY